MDKRMPQSTPDPLRRMAQHGDANRRAPPELFQVVIECRDEEQQRELFERLRREGMKVRLLVL